MSKIQLIIITVSIIVLIGLFMFSRNNSELAQTNATEGAAFLAEMPLKKVLSRQLVAYNILSLLMLKATNLTLHRM